MESATTAARTGFTSVQESAALVSAMVGEIQRGIEAIVDQAGSDAATM